MVAAQSIVAAYRTVADAGRPLHSLHAYFLRPGRHDVPIRFVGRPDPRRKTFTTRNVVAHQGGEAIFNLAASFAQPEPGISHQHAMPDAPPPDTLEDWEACARARSACRKARARARSRCASATATTSRPEQDLRAAPAQLDPREGPAARRSASPRRRAGLPHRPHAALDRGTRPRPAVGQADRRRASTTRCGSTVRSRAGRSCSTRAGCSTRRRVRSRTPRAA